MPARDTTALPLMQISFANGGARVGWSSLAVSDDDWGILVVPVTEDGPRGRRAETISGATCPTG
jgi:hypothetical protein